MTCGPTGQVSDLTCCRASFAAGVFSYHVNLQNPYAPPLGPAGSLVRHGFVGVDAFFILSGLVLAHVHPMLLPRAAEVRGFLLKRLVRIYPVHLAMIVLFLVLLRVSAATGLHPREPLQASIWRMLHRVPTEQKLLYGVTTTILTLALAVAVVRLVEQPALRAFGRRTRARRLAPSNVAA